MCGPAARLASWAAYNLVDTAAGSGAINPSASSRATMRTISVELPVAGLKLLAVRRAVEGVLRLAGAVELADSVNGAQRVRDHRRRRTSHESISAPAVHWMRAGDDLRGPR